MEYRYVYRRVEDVIGQSVTTPRSPHSYLTERLRFDLRERRDSTAVQLAKLQATAALCGNSHVDVFAMQSAVQDGIASIERYMMPYLEKPKPKAKVSVKENFDKYLDIIKQMRKKQAAEAAEATNAEAKNDGQVSA